MEKNKTIKLSDEDIKIFVDGLLNPPKPNKALKKAYKEYTKINKK